MNYKLHLNLFSEEGDYLLDILDDNGFMSSRNNIKIEDMPMLMKELSELTGEDKAIDILKKYYELFDLKSITIREK